MAKKRYKPEGLVSQLRQAALVLVPSVNDYSARYACPTLGFHTGIGSLFAPHFGGAMTIPPS